MSDLNPIDTDEPSFVEGLAARLEATLRQVLGREPDDNEPVIRPETALFVGGGLVFALVAALLVVTSEPRPAEGAVHATAKPDAAALTPVANDRKVVKHDERYDAYGGGGGGGGGGGRGGGGGGGAQNVPTPCVGDPDLLMAVRRTSGFGMITMQHAPAQPCQAP